MNFIIIEWSGGQAQTPQTQTEPDATTATGVSMVDRIEEIYPNRDGRRAVEIPEPSDFLPPELGELYDLVEARIHNILHPEIKRVKEALSNYKGFIEDIDDYEQELAEDFEEILNGGNGKADSSDVRAAKNWLKNITKDCTQLLYKYGSKGTRTNG